MSHTSSIKSIAITSIPALRSAVEELAKSGVKCRLQEKGTPRAYYSNQQGMGPADYVIVLEQSQYDVGVYKKPDNTYELRTDFWGGSVARTLGGTPTQPQNRDNVQQAQLGKLFQMYGIHATEQLARQQGQQTRRIVSPSGKIQLEITGNGI